MYLSLPTNHETPPEGTHFAVLTEFTDLGTHPNDLGDGKPRHEMRLGFRVFPSDEEGKRIEGDFFTSTIVTASIHPKSKFHGWATSLLGHELKTGFEMKELLGRPCLLELFHKTSPKGYTNANIASLISAPKGAQVPDLAAEFRAFDIALAGAWANGLLAYDDLDNWAKERVASSDEWNKAPALGMPTSAEKVVRLAPPSQHRAADIIDDDIPF